MRTNQGDIIEQRVTQRLLRNAVLHWQEIAADRKEKEERLKATLARTRVDLLVRPGSDQQVWEKCDVCGSVGVRLGRPWTGQLLPPPSAVLQAVNQY